MKSIKGPASKFYKFWKRYGGRIFCFRQESFIKIKRNFWSKIDFDNRRKRNMMMKELSGARSNLQNTQTKMEGKFPIQLKLSRGSKEYRKFILQWILAKALLGDIRREKTQKTSRSLHAIDSILDQSNRWATDSLGILMKTDCNEAWINRVDRYHVSYIIF